MKTVAVIVPTIREDRIAAFKKAWEDQFSRHRVKLVIVRDGDAPVVEHNGKTFGVNHVMGKGFGDLIFNRTDAVRNLGFAFAHKFIKPDVYISLDDDVLPDGDTIGDHLLALEKKVTISWTSTLNEIDVRGVPYEARNASPVMLSHGTWKGVPDLDGPTQLVLGVPTHFTPKVGPIPRGQLFPLCAMNFAFNKEAITQAYQAPMNVHGLDRFADIWCGIRLKREFDAIGWAVMNGAASVHHDRASNVYKNLQKEALGIELNERWWAGQSTSVHPYFELYEDRYKKWGIFVNSNL